MASYPHEEFLRQAKSAPEAVALRQGEQTVSYGELARQASGLAQQLHDRGVGAEDRVGVLIERSFEWVTALLAATLAGAAYVPLDPANPKRRLEYLLADSEAVLTLTDSSLSDRLPRGAKTMMLGREEERAGLLDVSPHIHSPGQLAYVVYTSGSTGWPKGVAVTHGGLRNLVRWHQRTYAITSDDCASHLAGLGFDAAIWELWPYLASGSSLYLQGAEPLEPSRLLSELGMKGVSIAFLPTPLAEAVLAEAAPALGPRLLLTGGDRLRRRPAPGFPRLVNHYGPTEGTVVSTAGEVTDREAIVPPPIGLPIEGTAAYVVDEQLSLVSDGVEGELAIGGEGVARGYLGRAALTAERFRPNPWGPPGSRLYLSGDQVRRLSDGRLEFIGRVDDQVKIRGIRVELGEIEAAMLELPAVKDAAVVLEEGRMGVRRLIAYLVTPATETVTDAELRAELAERLPAALIPSRYRRLEQLPLTLNGKVDRQALSPPMRENDV